MRDKTKRKRASPWLVFSALCFLLLVAFVLLWVSFTGAVNSVVSDPHGKAAVEQGDKDNDFKRVDWEYWQSVNPDIVAWVSVPGTNINHAVVQASADNPTYYLTHDVYKNYNPHGCPYVAADCAGFSGISTYIFGHNMGYDDSMFADFARFSSVGYALDHPVIYLQTPTENYALKVSAADIVSGYERSMRTDFEEPEALASWYAERYGDADVQIALGEPTSKLITFVTCSYNYFSNERTLVYTQP